MDSDDVTRGRVLSRREILGLLGAVGAAGAVFLVGCSGDEDAAAAQPTSAATQAEATSTPQATAATTASTSTVATTAVPSCVVLPALTEGPYFVDERLNRSDIRSDPGTGELREGALLTLNLGVLEVSGASCAPLADAMVDVWHCDALGAYSDVAQNGTVGQKFLRGFQTTDASGQVQFTTIYPGWYTGRATHIHFKIRKGNLEFTSQFFFDDALSDQVHASLTPYSERGASGRPQNASDSIYRESNGKLTLDVQSNGDGYAATFVIGFQA